MQQQVTINLAVDVIKALSDKSLDGNIYFMDNSPFHSINQGTENLCTLCVPGQILHWKVYPIDLQTPVAIKNITFWKEVVSTSDDSHASLNGNALFRDDLEMKTWTGIVPFMRIGHIYKYQVVLKMGNGVNSTMAIDTASLACACRIFNGNR